MLAQGPGPGPGPAGLAQRRPEADRSEPAPTKGRRRGHRTAGAGRSTAKPVPRPPSPARHHRAFSPACPPTHIVKTAADHGHGFGDRVLREFLWPPKQHSVLDLVCSPCYHVGLLCERPPEPLRVRDRRRPDRRDSEVQPVRPVPGHLLAFTRHPLCPGLSGPCRTPLPAAAVFPHLRPPGRSGGGDRGGDWGAWWWVAAPGEPPRPRLRSWHEQMPATTCKRLALTVAAPTDHD